MMPPLVICPCMAGSVWKGKDPSSPENTVTSSTRGAMVCRAFRVALGALAAAPSTTKSPDLITARHCSSVRCFSFYIV